MQTRDVSSPDTVGSMAKVSKGTHSFLLVLPTLQADGLLQAQSSGVNGEGHCR